MKKFKLGINISVTSKITLPAYNDIDNLCLTAALGAEILLLLCLHLAGSDLFSAGVAGGPPDICQGHTTVHCQKQCLHGISSQDTEDQSVRKVERIWVDPRTQLFFMSVWKSMSQP